MLPVFLHEKNHITTTEHCGQGNQLDITTGRTETMAGSNPDGNHGWIHRCQQETQTDPDLEPSNGIR